MTTENEMKTKLVCLLALTLFGCVGGDPDHPTKAAPPTLSCLGILSCVNANCSTDACVDSCMQQGTTDSQMEVTNLAVCYQNNACQDATCLQHNCMTELQACVGSSAPPQIGTPSDGQNLPPGNVPADFVGTWSAGDSFDPGHVQTFEFDADGVARYSDGTTGSLGDCTSSRIFDYNGTAVIDDSTITFYSRQASTTESVCGEQGNVDAQLVTSVYAYTWNTDGSFDSIEQSCADKYASDQASVNLYCRWTFRKQ